MWTRRLLSAIVVVVLAIVLFYSWGCGRSNDLYQMPTTATNIDGKSDTYMIEVLNPPAPPGAAEALVNLTWTDPNGNRGVVRMEQLPGMEPFSVVGQVPQDARVAFHVFFTFNADYCHNPKDELYCGPVRLYSNNRYYACSEKRVWQACEVQEIKTVLKAAMQNAEEAATVKYSCPGEIEARESKVEPWTPMICVYEPLDPLTF